MKRGGGAAGRLVGEAGRQAIECGGATASKIIAGAGPVTPLAPRRILETRPPHQPECPIPLSTRANDPILETIARAVFALFPRCVRCGRVIERFEDADVRILTNRVVHRAECLGCVESPREPA